MSDQFGAAHQRLGYETARTLFERNFRLLNEHDVRHIPTIFTEEIELRDDAWPEIINGHAAVERFVTALWRALPDFRFELVEGPSSPTMATAPPPARQRFNPRERAAALPSSYTTTRDTTQASPKRPDRKTS